MKHWIKRGLKVCWGATAPVRRPIARRVDARVRRVVARGTEDAVGPAVSEASACRNDVNGGFHRVEYSLGELHYKFDRHSVEVDLSLASLVREIARLQHQIETIRDVLEAAAARPGGLHVVVDDDHHDHPHAAAG